MSWIKNFQLFLFDFDGLLVDTERTHFAAYTYTLSKYGVKFDIDFKKYCELTHHSATGLQEYLYENHPKIKENNYWPEIYDQKKVDYVEILSKKTVNLMPGVSELLTALKENEILHCVVTHSPKDHVELIKEKNNVLKGIPVWFTREDYTKPKPHPECYQHAIKTLAKEGDKVIGFEDTPRGISALLGTQALPVLVCKQGLYDIEDLLQKHTNVVHIETLKNIADAMSIF